MPAKNTGRKTGAITAYAAKRKVNNRPTAKNVATHVGRGTTGRGAEKLPSPLGEYYLAPSPSPKAQYAKALYDVYKSNTSKKKKYK